MLIQATRVMGFSALISVWLALVAMLSTEVYRCEAVAKFDGSQRLTFKTPELTEEEEHSLFLPDDFQCDGCKAVAFQLYSEYEDFNRRHRHYKYNLPEWEILEVTEKACDFEAFSNSNYGLKDVDGVHRLTGPGLEADDLPGVVSGGGKWPKRLWEVCASFVEHLGEEDIYAAYRRHPKNRTSLESFLCRGEGVTGACGKTGSKIPTTTRDL